MSKQKRIAANTNSNLRLGLITKLAGALWAISVRLAEGQISASRQPLLHRRRALIVKLLASLLDQRRPADCCSILVRGDIGHDNGS